MKGKAYKQEIEPDYWGWMKCFLWLPTRVHTSKDHWRWMWLEDVEVKRCYSGIDVYYNYYREIGSNIVLKDTLFRTIVV